MLNTASLRVAVDTKQVKAADTDLDALSASAAKAEAATQGLGQASSRAGAGMAVGARQARGVNVAMRSAGGSTANLAAQFNDIGVMLAAGQSPLQLALQQGTQVNQVLGTMGSTGASRVAALKAAFLSVVSPANLVTLGVIAGGVALAQWGLSAISAGDNADDLADAIQSLGDEAREARDEVELFNRGLQTTAQLQVLDAIAAKEAEIAKVLELADRARGRTARGLENRAKSLQNELQVMRDQVAERNNAVAAAERLERIQDRANRAGSEYVKRLEAQKQSRIEAEGMLATLIEQNNIQAAINRYGEDSAQVSSLRADAERDAFEEMLGTLDVSQDLKDELMGAFLVGQDIASTDMSAGIVTAAQAARDLAAELQVSLGVAFQLANMADSARAGVSGPDGAVQQVRGAREDAIVFQRTYPASNSRRSGGARSRSSGGGGGGGGKSEAQREAERQRNEDMRDAERILDGLKSTQDEYNDALAQANRLLEVGVLPMGAYTDHVAQLKQELLDQQWEDSGFDVIASDIAGAIAQADSLGDAFDNLGDVFRNTIQNMAQDLIQSGINSLMQQAFGGVLGLGSSGGGSSAGGILSGLLSGLPSRDGGGYTWDGPRSGGIDGKGGQLMIGHPQETVIDHTKGQTMGGTQNVNVRVYVDDSGNLAAMVDGRAASLVAENNKTVNDAFNQRSSGWANDRRRRGAQ